MNGHLNYLIVTAILRADSEKLIMHCTGTMVCIMEGVNILWSPAVAVCERKAIRGIFQSLLAVRSGTAYGRYHDIKVECPTQVTGA